MRGRLGGGESDNSESSPPPPTPTLPRKGGGSVSAEDIQTRIYDIGMAHYGKENLRDWFKANYELLLGQSQGPRMGSFIHLFGAKETIGLIDAALLRQHAA